MNTIIENALLNLNRNDRTVIISDSGEKHFASSVSEVLIDLINQKNCEEITVVADRFGKTPGYLCRLLNIKEVYALTMSDSAAESLKETDIQFFYQNRVSVLTNDANDDMDTFEKVSISEDEAEKIYTKANARLSEIRIKDFWNANRGNAIKYTRIIDISNNRTAVSSCYDSYFAENARMPRKKDLMIGVDQFSMPVSLLEVTGVIVVPVSGISEELAETESSDLENWKKEHLPALFEEAEKIGIKADEDLWVVFETFKTV